MSKSKLDWFLTTLGSLCTIVPVVLGLYDMARGAKRPHLTYGVHPIRSLVADPAASQRLQLLLDGRPLKVPVYVVRILVYNAGSYAIEPKDFRKGGLSIVTNPRVALIDATVEKSYRSAAAFALDRNGLNDGMVPIHWQRLEEDEGAVVQLVYARTGPQPEFSLDGSLNDEPVMIRLDFDLASRLRGIRARVWLIVLLVMIDFSLFGGVIYGWFKKRRALWLSCVSGFFVETLTLVLWLITIAMGPRLPLVF
jgi:hypothetical protein